MALLLTVMFLCDITQYMLYCLQWSSYVTSPSSGFIVDNGVLCVGSLPGTMAAHSLMNAIKAKCTPDEAAQLLRELPNKFPNGEDNGQSAVKCVCCVPWCGCCVLCVCSLCV